MNAFLLIAHGSRRKESNDEVHELSKKIIDQNLGQFDQLRCCFLELAKPLIPDAIDQLVLEGANQITVFPYFLAGGLHVAEDVPEEIEKAKSMYPNVNFKILPHLGKTNEMPELILKQLSS